VYTPLGETTLKTGERMTIGRVACPDPEWATRVSPLLGHKGQPWHFHIETAVREPLDDLNTLFYLGTIDGVAVCNVMIVGTRGSAGDTVGTGATGVTAEGVGILAHVYTVPEQRRKGAYSQLMALQMEDTRRLGYAILTLGTGFESPPYWIYHSFGFRSIDGSSGRMKWLATPEAEASWFRAGAAVARPLRWEDWAPLNALASQLAEADEALPRSWAFGLLKGHGSVERSFLDLRRSMPRESPRSLDDLHGAVASGANGAQPIALTLESEHGAAVGWAVLQPDDLALRDGWRLDFFVHPAFRAHTGRLLEALPLPPGARLGAYTTGPESYRAAALLAAGFDHVAALPEWVVRGEAAPRLPLHVYARAAGRGSGI
jgi:hypothetical protein